MNSQRWLIILGMFLTGCGTTQLAPVGLYKPMAPYGISHCETSGQCVIRLESGQSYVSVGEQSVTLVSFSGLGGDVKHHYDFLVTAQNIGDTDLYFDPNDIEGYAPDALNDLAAREGKKLTNLRVLSGIATGLGGAVNYSALETLEKLHDQERFTKMNQYADQMLSKQVIVPGSETGGRLILQSQGSSTEVINVTIPIGSDVHRFRFAKRKDDPIANMKGEAGGS